MKTWLLMRHGKSEHDIPGVDDHDRPLNKRGKCDGPRMGEWLREQGYMPDRIVSSTAVRARTTAEAVAEGAAFPGELTLTGELYMAGVRDYLKVLQKLDDAAESVLTVAHNPGCEDVIEHFTGKAVTMPTAAIARLELEVDSWAHLDGTTPAKLGEVWRPKEI